MVLRQPGESEQDYYQRLKAQLEKYELRPGRYYGVQASHIRREVIKLHKKLNAQPCDMAR